MIEEWIEFLRLLQRITDFEQLDLKMYICRDSFGYNDWSWDQKEEGTFDYVRGWNNFKANFAPRKIPHFKSWEIRIPKDEFEQVADQPEQWTIEYSQA